MINFEQVKSRVSIEDSARLLGLELKYVSDTQYRGPCPRCKAGGDRALVITHTRGLFYCFAGRLGGDQIALAAHVKNISVKDAAEFLNQEPTQNEPCTLQPLTYLDTSHESLAALGVTAQSCQHFGAGYAPKGIMRGRLAIPIHDLTGKLVAYCGRAVDEEQTPRLLFPRGFDATNYVFNLHRQTGEVMLVHDPLDVLRAYEHGVENVASFLRGEGA